MRGTCICDTQEPNVVLLCGCISLQCARLALEASAAQVPATYALLEHTLLVAAWRSAGVSSFALMLLVSCLQGLRFRAGMWAEGFANPAGISPSRTQ